MAALRTTLAVTAWLLGVPTLLLAISGPPVPDAAPSADQLQTWLDNPLDPAYRAGTAEALAWTFWAVVTIVVLTATASRLRTVRWAAIVRYLPPPTQGLAAAVVGTAVVATSASALPAVAAPATTTAGLNDHGPAHLAIGSSPAPAPLAIAPAHHSLNAAAETSTAVSAPTAVPARVDRSASTCRVERGDTLWDLAEEHLGDPHRWRELYHLNADTYDENGRMRGGNHIEAGWVLTLPPPATPSSRPATPRQHTPPAGADQQPSAPAPAIPPGPATSVPAPATTAAPVTTTPPGPAEATSASAANPPAVSPRPSAAPSTPATPSSSTETPTTVATPPVTPSVSGSDGQQPRPEKDRTTAPGISLSSGSWLDLGLAAAVTAAIALAWAHRRRRYTPRPLSPDLHLDDPDLAPMPAVVTQIRRRLHHRQNTASTNACTGSAAGWIMPISTAATHTLHVAAADPTDPDQADEPTSVADTQEHDSDAAGETPVGPVARPVVPTLTNPAAAVWPPSGLGLTGPGAPAAARGFMAAALADVDPDSPPGRVVLPSGTATALFEGALVRVPGTARLVVTDDLAQALDLLEQQILHRSRLVYAHEADTVAAMRAADPDEEATPPILLIAHTDATHERTRIAALLAQGQRLDIHGVLLGEWPTGDTVTVDTVGTTTPGDGARHGHHPADIGRLAVLTPDDTVAVLNTLAAAHPGPPPPPPPIEAAGQHAVAGPAPEWDAEAPPADDARVLAALAELGEATAAAVAAHLDVAYPVVTAKLVHAEHAGRAETTRAGTGRTLWRLTPAGRAAITAPAPEGPFEPRINKDPEATVQPTEGDAPPEDRYTEIGTVLRSPDPTTTFTSEHPPVEAPDHSGQDAPGHVAVTVLGEAAIVALNPDRRPRRKALELLVYLVVHDGTATVEAILDDLMPEAPASKAPERLHTYVSDLRAVMRRTGGPGTYLTHPHHRYTLNPDAVDADLWRMRAAIRRAHQTDDPQHRIAALQQAVDCYRGPLADGADYEWAESYREAIRQQALDAHLELADALTGNPAAQARILEAAIEHSPYSEHVYRHAMRARAALGHIDTIRTLRHALDRALAAIDAEPDDDTIALTDRLFTDLQHSNTRRSDAVRILDDPVSIPQKITESNCDSANPES